MMSISRAFSDRRDHRKAKRLVNEGFGSFSTSVIFITENHSQSSKKIVLNHLETLMPLAERALETLKKRDNSSQRNVDDTTFEDAAYRVETAKKAIYNIKLQLNMIDE
jgi:hypothetical protein